MFSIQTCVGVGRRYREGVTDRVETVGDVREVVARLGAVLATLGAVDASVRLEGAAEFTGDLAEELLVMREALVATRATWEPLPEGVPARHALVAAKRIAIDM